MKTSLDRRKLIKGSLAAPVVLTLSSASASSLTSFGRCLRNPPTGATPDFFTTPRKADAWFRKAVKVEQLTYQGQVRGMFYDDPLLGRYVDTRAPYATLNFGASARPAGWSVTGESKRLALVFFDHDSAAEYRYITLQRPSGYSATTMSCYGSFRA